MYSKLVIAFFIVGCVLAVYGGSLAKDSVDGAAENVEDDLGLADVDDEGHSNMLGLFGVQECSSTAGCKAKGCRACCWIFGCCGCW